MSLVFTNKKDIPGFFLRFETNFWVYFNFSTIQEQVPLWRPEKDNLVQPNPFEFSICNLMKTSLYKLRLTWIEPIKSSRFWFSKWKMNDEGVLWFLLSRQEWIAFCDSFWVSILVRPPWSTVVKFYPWGCKKIYVPRLFTLKNIAD